MKWYQKSWGIILLLIFFAPVGIFLMFRYSKWSIKTKSIITALLVAFTIFSYNTEPTEPAKQAESKKEKTENVNKVKVKKSDSKKEETKTVNTEKSTQVSLTVSSDGFNYSKYKLIVVDGGDKSGTRQSNVKVDVGFGEREYWAYTNEYGQLIRVEAKMITLQNPAIEKVLSSGRYYSDEAKVPGTERSDLDEGHVIADSLGGVSNAYNITPQDSVLNRHGNQAYMEKVIRDAGGCTDFVAIITYPDTQTQIPNHYKYTYILKGNPVTDEFDNVNPDKANQNLNSGTGSSSAPPVTSTSSSGNTSGNSGTGTNSTPPVTSTSSPGNTSGNNGTVQTNPNVEQAQVGDVFWADGGTKYHSSKDCRTLARSKNIHAGSIAEASQNGHASPCGVCY